MNDIKLSEDGGTVTFTEKRRINIVQDLYSESPREWDNQSTILAFHKRYNLNEDKNCPCNERNYDKELVSEYVDGIVKDGGYITELYIYDHGGIQLSTGGFSCGWDSGKVGFIIVTKEKLAESNLDVTKDLAKIKEIISNELDVYNDYLMGNCYRIIDNASEIDCGGYIGSDGYDAAVAEIESYGLSEYLDSDYTLD